MNEAKKKKTETYVVVSRDGSMSALGVFFVYLISGLFLGVGFWVARNKFAVDLVSDPSLTLFLLWVLYSTSLHSLLVLYCSSVDFELILNSCFGVHSQSIEFPVVAIIYSFLRKAPEKCSVSVIHF